MRVLLISMPFGAADRPSLGPSLLKAGLVAAGHECEVRYLNLEFAREIGLELYDWIVDDIPYTAFAGDWCFTPALYDSHPEGDWDYVKSVLIDTWRQPRSGIARLLSVRQRAVAFVETCLERVERDRWDVVGFTSTFVQNIASLALARRIKQTQPEVRVVFGGANWEDDMGSELFAQFDFVDFACRGEADESFPWLIDSLAEGRDDFRSIPGLLYRTRDGEPVTGERARPVRDVDSVPVPDFADYYAGIRTDPAFYSINPVLPMETSRGCWWGEHSHCVFCGLNGNGMMFRSKSSARALSELDHLTRRWHPPMVAMVDNILDMKYFHEFIPSLARRGGEQRLFYETKANLKRAQVRLLRDAGIRNIQPGIESLSNHVLDLMAKGTSTLQNIQLLKWCREYGVNVDWNLLYGFPGETREDYETILQLLPRIRHLQPPSGSGPIRLDRFSPYQQDPARFGMKNVRPLDVYRHIYPFADDVLSRIACYFDFDYSERRVADDLVADVLRAVDEWVKCDRPGALSVRDLGDRLLIRDSRSESGELRYELRDHDRIAYLACDRITSPARVKEVLERDAPAMRFSAESIARSLGALSELGLMLEDQGRFLALGVYERFPGYPGEIERSPVATTRPMAYDTGSSIEHRIQAS